jgi:hypothetical protein
MIFVNEKDQVLCNDEDQTFFWCDECKDVHQIDIREIHKTTDNKSLVAVCPNTGIAYQWDIKNA